MKDTIKEFVLFKLAEAELLYQRNKNNPTPNSLIKESLFHNSGRIALAEEILRFLETVEIEGGQDE